MFADLPTEITRNGKNWGDTKEMVMCQSAVLVHKGKAVNPVTVRWYMARSGDGARPMYCSVWVGGPNHGAAGHGKASGYGYHKASAAFDAALTSAGITVWQDRTRKRSADIDGCGDRAVQDAMKAIARKLYGKGKSTEVMIIVN